MEAHPALEETTRGFHTLPIGAQPEISLRGLVLLVSSFKRDRGADLAFGNIWVSFSSEVRGRAARAFESLFVDFFLVA